MSDLDAARRRSLAYFDSTHCASQWNDVLRLLLDELYAAGGERDAGVFLRHIGARMASELMLPDQQTLEGLERTLNELWRERDWGWVSLTAGETRLTIEHGAYPVAGHSEAERARGARAASALLAGAYGVWLEHQGGDSSVPLRVVTAEAGKPLEFVYAREEVAGH